MDMRNDIDALSFPRWAHCSQMKTIVHILFKCTLFVHLLVVTLFLRHVLVILFLGGRVE
jgi:hypothetical protein